MHLSHDMENMEMKKLAFRMSVPTILSMLSLALYNLVDGAMVSSINQNALTAISLAQPVQTLMIAVALGTAVGANSLLSRRLGEKNEDVVNKIIANTFALNIIGWLITAVLGFFGAEVFIRFFKQSEVVVEYGVTYLSICTVFSLGLYMQTTFEKIFEALGKPSYTTMENLAGAVINIVLDFILIFGFYKIPAMGIRGAAIATVIAQFCATIIGILHIRHFDLNLKLKDFLLSKEIVRDIYIVGFPTIVLESISSFVTVILNKIFSVFSENAIPIWGLYMRVQTFLFMTVYGLTNAMVPIVAYNFGAKNKKRVKEAFKIFMVAVETLMIAGTLFFNFGTDIIFDVFHAEESLRAVGGIALKTLSISFVFAGISLVLSAFFQAIGKGKYSLIIFLLRQLSINIPILYVVGKYINTDYMWSAFILSEILAMVIALLFMRKIKKEVIEE
ncbi:MAG: MATE family efflux transporter [Clostridia bacterium]|nr:MATE family efflux transporter [Clostridia bacterium]